MGLRAIISWIGEAIAIATGCTCRVALTPPIHFDLYLDEDRDGNVDDDPADEGAWEWGADNYGAVVMVNNDDDDGDASPDLDDNVVNGDHDVHELAPLAIRRDGPATVPNGWRVLLSVHDENLIRIFDARDGTGTEIIGPNTGDTYELPDLDPMEQVFGMEALRYAGTDFDGLIEIGLRVESPNGVVTEKFVDVRVAPWIMPNHCDRAERVYVVDAQNSNRRFRDELDVMVRAAGCQLVQHRSNDIWMQDCMEFGYSNLPGHGIRATMRAPRNRPLRTFPATLLDRDVGYHEKGDLTSDTTFDSTGNLEVTPPVTSAAGKVYPWGRIYYGGVGRRGEPFDDEVEDFLTAQMVQEPISIDTSWLTVGHVDEFIGIAPAGAGAFKLLLASPARAYEILNANAGGGPGSVDYTIVGGDTLSVIAGRHGMTWRELYDYAGNTGVRNRNRLSSGDPDLIHVGEVIIVPGGGDPMLVDRAFPEYNARGRLVGWREVETTIDDYLADGIPELHLTAARLDQFNRAVQARIDTTRDQLVRELGLDANNDIIQIPIIFMPNEDFPNLADSLTAGMINMLVINDHCIIPKPFGPVVAPDGDLFEKDLGDQLRALGLQVNYLDDWEEYHVNLGEVHCGTNTLREPTEANWWEYEP